MVFLWFSYGFYTPATTLGSPRGGGGEPRPRGAALSAGTSEAMAGAAAEQRSVQAPWRRPGRKILRGSWVLFKVIWLIFPIGNPPWLGNRWSEYFLFFGNPLSKSKEKMVPRNWENFWMSNVWNVFFFWNLKMERLWFWTSGIWSSSVLKQWPKRMRFGLSHGRTLEKSHLNRTSRAVS